MITLSTVQNFIQRPKTIFPIIGIIFLIIFLIILVFIRYANVNKNEELSPVYGILPYPDFVPKELQHKTGNINVNLNKVDTPESATGNVYELTVVPDYLAKIEKVASELGFSNVSNNDGRFLSWLKDGKSLTFDNKTNRLNYSSTLIQTESRIISSTDKAALTAQNILSQLNLLPAGSKQKVTSLRVEGLNFATAATQEVADVYEVDFFESLDGYPVFGQSQRTGTITVLVDKEGNLIKLETRLNSFGESKIATYPLKTLDEAVADVKVNGVVVETDIPGFDPLLGESLDIETVDLSTINYAYFKSVNNSFITPIFIFFGNLKLIDGREGNATMYLSAIKNQYLTVSAP